MNPFFVTILLISISSSWAQNLEQFGINPGQPSIYPFLAPPPPPLPPMIGGGPAGPGGPHGPGHVHAPHPEGPHELFRQTPRHGGPGGYAGGPPPPVPPFTPGIRLPAGYQYGLPPQPPQFQLPSSYPDPMGLDQLMTTSTVECSCSVSLGIQNTSSMVLPRTPQSSFPGIVCGPGSVALCRIQCMAQALNASFDLINSAVNPTTGSGVSLQQFICGNNTTTNIQTDSAAGSSTGTSRLVNIKSETSCSEQSTDYSSTNKRTESIALGPQECSTLTSIGSFHLPTITPQANPPVTN